MSKFGRYTYTFEKLKVWNKAKELAKVVYTVTELFPETEKFGLTSQLRRSSISICSDIAEGSARKTNKDKAHFTTMVFSSAVELLNQLIISLELKFIEEEDYLMLRKSLESVTNKLNALRNYQIDQ